MFFELHCFQQLDPKDAREEPSLNMQCEGVDVNAIRRSFCAVEFAQVRDHFTVKCCCLEGVILHPWL